MDAEHTDVSSADAGSAFAGRRVLVVDDNALVRDMLEAILSQIGVARIAAADGADAALEIILREATPFDAIFCDLQMPGRDGIELIRDIADRKPGSAVVPMSGEDGSVLTAAGDLAARQGLRVLGTLAKPFTVEAIRNVLARSADVGRSRTGRSYAPIDVSELRHGLENGEIVPHYQPKIDLATREMTSVEALARWRHPVHGLIGPDLFIPMAEDHGLIDRLTDIMLAQTIEQCRQWKLAGLPAMMSVNLSVDSLARLDLPEYLAESVERAGLDTSEIILELTESRFSDNPTSLLDITTRMRLKRFELSIDDFGTGFSGLRQLQRLPFTELKVDRAFVSGASRDHRARMILEASVDLARRLGMTIVAEGVESREDWDLVAALGCDLAQGYFVSRPLPPDEIPDWMQRWQSSG